MTGYAPLPRLFAIPWMDGVRASPVAVEGWPEYVPASAVAEAVAAEREACALCCDAVSDDAWAQYKGRTPYKPRNHNRANPEMQGVSNGAAECAAAIRARKEA